jgi:hypothetical protein
MDCHNRPSHHYYTPQEFIDQAMTSGEIPQHLPYIKKIAMDLFVDPYEFTDTAIHRIKTYPYEFYEENAPEIIETRKEDIEKAIEGMIDGFSKNIFPEMWVSWDEYDSHIGHKTYKGCFRCHDDNHKSEDGDVIRKDCEICHTIVSQGKQGQEEFALLNEDLPFIHPVELEDGWEGELCSDCHRYLY